jgi:hypothetical protein
MTGAGYREIYTLEQIQSMTLRLTSAAFHRYFQTGGEALRESYRGNVRRLSMLINR